ncbi:MAG: helix-turn-helix domain-containing protein [Lachnospiraceae bacterium]|nr:helix-turn-helix domain-containing protein [Lachnospiraceae bacterium]
MISNFDLVKLNDLLKDFYNLTQIRITVFDETFHELAAYPPHLSPFCRIIRANKHGESECKNCDTRSCELAAKLRSPYTYRCHAGLTESITPLYLGNIVIGYLFLGQVFTYPSHEEGWKKIQELCSHFQIDMNALQDACYKSPLITDDYINSASHILQAVATYLCLEQMFSLRKKELPVQIDEYISDHFTEELDALSICRKFHIGKTQLYEISRQNYGIGIAEHIRNLRIEKAKKLLEDSNMPLADIASECGFRDYNYFITVFKNVTGMPPKKYTKIYLKERPWKADQ